MSCTKTPTQAWGCGVSLARSFENDARWKHFGNSIPQPPIKTPIKTISNVDRTSSSSSMWGSPNATRCSIFSKTQITKGSIVSRKGEHINTDALFVHVSFCSREHFAKLFARHVGHC